MARQANDPARQAAEKRYKTLMLEYEALWEQKRGDFVARPRSGVTPRKMNALAYSTGRATAERRS